jgi:hypothetical protein
VPGIRLPKWDDALKWADWLELSAINRPDRCSSRGDLEGAFRLSGYLDSQEAIETRCNEVFTELTDRITSAGDAYPFSVAPSLLEAKSGVDRYPAYFFCLCLSYTGWNKEKGRGQLAARMFEDLSCLAAKSYIGGEVARFAYPRKGGRAELPKGFKDAIAALTTDLAEGEGCVNTAARSTKDDALDVVAWRHFPDRLAGKLLLVGQCASGEDWVDKLNDLNPIATTNEWMRRPIISPILKAMFIPHRVRREEWEHCSRRAGLIFDRCRLAHWVHNSSGAMDEHFAWATECLGQVIA